MVALAEIFEMRGEFDEARKVFSSLFQMWLRFNFGMQIFNEGQKKAESCGAFLSILWQNNPRSLLN